MKTSLVGVLALSLAGCAALTHQSQFIDGRSDLRQQEAISGQIHYALPRGLVKVVIERDAKALTVNAPTLLTTADPVARFAVHLDESGFADDKYAISVDSSGLLTSSKSDNFDKSPEIIQKAVELFAEGTKALISGRSTRGTASGVIALRPISEEFIIDPYLTPQRKSRTGALISFSNIDGSPLPRSSSSEIAESARRCQGSLCSRLLRPVRVKVALGAIIHREYVLMLPDPLLTVSHNVTRSACVQRVTTLTFSAGVLTTYDLNKPSEVLACLTIPVEALKTIVAIPSGLLTFRTEQIESRSSLLAAQTANLNAQVSRIEAQSNFLAALAARSAPVAEAAPQAAQVQSKKAPSQVQAAVAVDETKRWEERDKICKKLNVSDPSRVVGCEKDYNSCFKSSKDHGACLSQ